VRKGKRSLIAPSVPAGLLPNADQFPGAVSSGDGASSFTEENGFVVSAFVGIGIKPNAPEINMTTRTIRILIDL
jgi:hypothetical protein